MKNIYPYPIDKNQEKYTLEYVLNHLKTKNQTFNNFSDIEILEFIIERTKPVLYHQGLEKYVDAWIESVIAGNIVFYCLPSGEPSNEYTNNIFIYTKDIINVDVKTKDARIPPLDQKRLKELEKFANTLGELKTDKSGKQIIPLSDLQIIKELKKRDPELFKGGAKLINRDFWKIHNHKYTFKKGKKQKV